MKFGNFYNLTITITYSECQHPQKQAVPSQRQEAMLRFSSHQNLWERGIQVWYTELQRSFTLRKVNWYITTFVLVTNNLCDNLVFGSALKWDSFCDSENTFSENISRDLSILILHEQLQRSQPRGKYNSWLLPQYSFPRQTSTHNNNNHENGLTLTFGSLFDS